MQAHGQAHDLRAKMLLESADVVPEDVLRELGSRTNGLSQAERVARMESFGTNEVAREKRPSVWKRLLDNVRNPLVILLSGLGILSYLTRFHSFRAAQVGR